jgi:signal transduction histidine kinase
MKRRGSKLAKLETASATVPRSSGRRRAQEGLCRSKGTAGPSRANEALQDDAERLSAIIATQHDIATAGHDFRAVMTLIAKRTQKLTRASGAAIELVEHDELVYRLGTGTASRHAGLRLGLTSSLSGQCMRRNELLRCEDSETDRRVDRLACRKVGLRSMVVVPLHHNGEAVGVLKVLSTRPSAFTEQDVRALELMAGLIGAALSNAAEFESRQALLAEQTSAVIALQTRAHQQNVVTELSQHALEGRDLPTLLEDTVKLIRQILEVEYCGVLELRRDGDVLLLRSGAGWKEGYMGHAKVFGGREPLSGFSLLCGSPVILEDLRTERRFRGPPLLLDHGVVSGVTVIIHGRGKPYGILGVYTTKPRKFTNDDVHFLQSLATVLAAAIERRQLEEELVAINNRQQQRIGQDLHDGLCQQLAGIEFRNSVLVRRLEKEDDAKAEAIRIGELIRDVTRQAQLLAKGLSPVQLEADGLMSALEELTSNASKLFNVSCRFECRRPVPVPDNTVANHLYRIAQEAITNAVKHGHAKSIVVSLMSSPVQSTLKITDDGTGFPAGANTSSGLGLRIMQYRAEIIGATLKVGPAKGKGKGTTVMCILKKNQ